MCTEGARTATFIDTTEAEGKFIDRLKQFEAAAWNELYDTHASKIYRYLVVRLGDQEAAEELSAQVFEEACRRIGGYRHRGPPISAWLYRVAHNRMVDWRRKHRSLPLEADMAGPDQMAKVADRDELARALDTLTGDQQQVLVLRHIEGHTPTSAAAMMGKNAGAIRALEFRALNSLRKNLSRGREQSAR
jgi:RNA polymerase sigma-70 factor (ECF subfamily)